MDQITRCPKCGCADQAVKYHGDEDQLGITCRRCGFNRFVPPLHRAIECPESPDGVHTFGGSSIGGVCQYCGADGASVDADRADAE